MYREIRGGEREYADGEGPAQWGELPAAFGEKGPISVGNRYSDK